MIARTLYLEKIATKTKRSICMILILMVTLVLAGCIQRGDAQNSIAGEWHQNSQGNQKVMTVSSTCDSYSITDSDGTVVSGAIFQDETIADEPNAYVFYFEQPSVITSDPAMNKVNHRNMKHQVMYLHAGDTFSTTHGERAATLEGYYEGAQGKTTVLDGSWHRTS